MGVILADDRGDRGSILWKLLQINWLLVLLLCGLAAIGFAMLYSAGGGSFDPWVSRQAPRFAVGLALMLLVAVIDIRVWSRFAYAAYGVTLALLVAVEVMGSVGMGAQRWLDLGFTQFQPSELMKITLVMALARYFHGASAEDVRGWLIFIPPALLIAAPVALVVKQPDLGGALMLAMLAVAMLWLVGMRWWKFALGITLVLAAVPAIWHSDLLRDYQRARVLVFLDPGRDPLGAGYHIIQSKIALGSGAVWGKGFLQGTQSHLNFLPEKQTDFIFTMLAEEFGMVGALGLLALYLVLFVYGYAIAMRSNSHYGRLVAVGIVTSVFLSVFVNVAMVMGLIPAKGVALPMVSYGGTSMIVTMIGFGMLINAWVHRDTKIARRGIGED
jgi:rod shape determining protein RodA